MEASSRVAADKILHLLTDPANQPHPFVGNVDGLKRALFALCGQLDAVKAERCNFRATKE